MIYCSYAVPNLLTGNLKSTPRLECISQYWLYFTNISQAFSSTCTTEGSPISKEEHTENSLRLVLMVMQFETYFHSAKETVIQSSWHAPVLNSNSVTTSWHYAVWVFSWQFHTSGLPIWNGLHELPIFDLSLLDHKQSTVSSRISCGSSSSCCWDWTSFNTVSNTKPYCRVVSIVEHKSRYRFNIRAYSILTRRSEVLLSGCYQPVNHIFAPGWEPRTVFGHFIG